jgi:hypothetical protein
VTEQERQVERLVAMERTLDWSAGLLLVAALGVVAAGWLVVRTDARVRAVPGSVAVRDGDAAATLGPYSLGFADLGDPERTVSARLSAGGLELRRSGLKQQTWVTLSFPSRHGSLAIVARGRGERLLLDADEWERLRAACACDGEE